MMLRYLDDDGRLSADPLVWDHPVDHIEPETKPADLVRDARNMCQLLLNDFAEEMRRALTNGGVRHVLVRLYGIAYGMGLNICGDTSMSARADQLGVTRQTLSKVARNWNDAHDLPPSFHQKPASAVAAYAKTRREVVAASNGNGSNRAERR